MARFEVCTERQSEQMNNRFEKSLRRDNEKSGTGKRNHKEKLKCLVEWGDWKWFKILSLWCVFNDGQIKNNNCLMRMKNASDTIFTIFLIGVIAFDNCSRGLCFRCGEDGEEEAEWLFQEIIIASAYLLQRKQSFYFDLFDLVVPFVSFAEVLIFSIGYSVYTYLFAPYLKWFSIQSHSSSTLQRTLFCRIRYIHINRSTNSFICERNAGVFIVLGPRIQAKRFFHLKWNNSKLFFGHKGNRRAPSSLAWQMIMFEPINYSHCTWFGSKTLSSAGELLIYFFDMWKQDPNRSSNEFVDAVH